MSRFAAGAVALVAPFLAGWLGGDLPAQDSSPRTVPANVGARIAAPAPDDFAPAGMARIEAGAFLPGTTPREAEDIEKYFRIGRRQKERFWRQMNLELVAEKHRQLEVPTYYVDRYECTNRQYYFFMKATGTPAPDMGRDHPLRWRGGRLPGATQLFFKDEVKSWPGLVNRIRAGAAKKSTVTPAGRIWASLDDRLRAGLEKVKPDAGDLDEHLKDALIAALNKLVRRRDLFVQKYWRGVSVKREAVALVNKGLDKLSDPELTRFNRLLLDAVLEGAVEKGQPREAMLVPVTGITFFEAKSCAEWMGKRLLTEMEWEKAARGPLQGDNPARWYPWGNAFTKKETDYCNWALYWASPLNREMKPEGLSPVGAFPKGASVFGVHDMIGNALEYTADSWKPHRTAVKVRNAVFLPPESQHLVVVKGGAYGEQFRENLRIAARNGWNKDAASEAIGFRCAKDTQLGRSALGRIAHDLFQGLWDERLVKLDLERGLACREKVTYDQEFPDYAIITDYKWIGFVNIRKHLYDSVKRLRSASDKIKRKRKGYIFLGVIHTDVTFTDPPLKAGNYAIVYQKDFRILAEEKAKAGKHGKKGTGKKKAAGKKKKKKKKDRGKKNDKRKKKNGGKKGGPEEAGAGQEEKAGNAVPEVAPVPRILFVDASGKPAAAIANPVIRTVRAEDRARLSLFPATDKTPATALLHLAMLQKFEKKKYLVVDLPLACRQGRRLEGWRE